MTAKGTGMRLITSAVVLARSSPKLKGRTSSRKMQEDRTTAPQPADWRRQRAEDNYILANQDVTPTTDVDTKIKVEELMNAEETRDCQPYKKVKSTCGQTNWIICRHAD
eukprot:7472680-Heterocapsa_arctica.AAC.1